MKSIQCLALIFLCSAFLSPCLAQDDAPTATATPLSQPLTLKALVKLNDSDHRHVPHAPKIGPTGKAISVDVDDHIPRGASLDNLSSAEAVSLIDGFNQTDTKSEQALWHAIGAVNYCHYRDGDNQWYGWRTGPDFHWVLFRGELPWYHDRFADRWLYYDRGNWWWQGDDKKNPVQVYLEDNHYYACNANGVVGDNLGTTGTEEVVTKPIVKETPTSPKDDENPASQMGMGGAGGTSGMGMKSY
jgi:hypothetical protein